MTSSFSGPQLIVLGLAILVIGFLLWRSFALGKRSRERDPANEARQEVRAAERSAESGIRRLEVRLYDYGREVEGRVETTLTLLDRLIREAEHETDCLQQLLLTTGQLDEATGGEEGSASDTAPLTVDEQRMVRGLSEAGYTVPQIAQLLRRPSEELAVLLSGDNDTAEADRTDAA